MQEKVKKLRCMSNQIRQDVVKMLNLAGSGHPGGSLSAADIMTALYFDVMNVSSERVKDKSRDKFVLSKGHAAPVLYATLAEKGYFSKDELWKLRKLGSMLQGHPDMKNIPGVEMSTGSLGQGFSAAVGMSLAAKLDGDSRIYTLLGDGELNEGLVWEAAMAAAHYKLDNLVAVIDHNGLQIDGKNDDVMGVNPIDEKFAAFGWNVINVDGHSMEELLAAFESAKTVKNMPTAIVAKTVKGKGVSYMEDNAGWHGKAPSKDECDKAIEELSCQQ